MAFWDEPYVVENLKVLSSISTAGSGLKMEIAPGGLQATLGGNRLEVSRSTTNLAREHDDPNPAAGEASPRRRLVPSASVPMPEQWVPRREPFPRSLRMD